LAVLVTSAPKGHKLKASEDAPEGVKQSMKLWVNGEERSLEAVADVAALVAVLGLDGRKVAVERNLEIVPRSTYGSTPVLDGDRIEIVHFIGGG
jgi:thiamine biosynthesis protein ThiS